jgi:hypothetical protein
LTCTVNVRSVVDVLRAHTTQAFTLRDCVTSVLAYWPAQTGGVHVAADDFTGIAEIITGAGPGGLPHVKAYQLTVAHVSKTKSYAHTRFTAVGGSGRGRLVATRRRGRFFGTCRPSCRHRRYIRSVPGACPWRSRKMRIVR